MRVPCKSCGEKFERKAGTKGRPAELCPKCRKPRGEERNPEANRDRFNARRREKRKSAESSTVGDMLHKAGELAAALAVFPNVEHAAQAVGIDLTGDKLAALEQLARSAFPGVVEASIDDLGLRLISTINLFLMSAQRQRVQVAPRDLPHVTRALSQVHAMIIGDKKPKTWDELRMVLVGPDGKAFDPNETPQVVFDPAKDKR